MKITLSFIVSLFFAFQTYSQFNYTIELKDSLSNFSNKRIKGFDYLKIKNKKIKADNISKIIVAYSKDSIVSFFPLNIKNFKRDKQISRCLANVVYSNGNLELYQGWFIKEFNINKLNKVNLNYHSQKEVFIKRKDKAIAYSIGLIDGIGNKKIYKRLKEFF